MTRFTVLLDGPSEPVKRVQIAALGDYEDPRYGKFSITPANVENWQRNLAKLPGGEALIDFEHRSERSPRDSRAAGWITSIDVASDCVMADVRWTPEGEKALREETYRFMSPAYGQHSDEHGNHYDDALVSAALTNKPALTGMPAVVLASEERVRATIDELKRDQDLRLLDVLASKQRENHVPQPTPSESDSQRTMDTEVLTALDLGEDTDVAAAVARINELKANADRAPETKTLEQTADAEGKKVISLDTYRELAGASERIAKLEQERADERFVRLFEDCQRVGKVLPDERDGFTELHQEAPASAAKMLAKRLETGPQLINTKPSGWDNGNVQAGDAPPGVDSGAHQLHNKVLAKARELGKDPARDYQMVLDRMIEGGEL